MTEPLLDVYGEQGFRLTFPYSPQMVAQVRQALGFTFDKRSRSWVCEGPEAVLDLQRFNITIHATDAAIARFQQFRQQLDHILDLKAWNPGEDLYAFQQVGTEVLAGQYKGVLGDQQGLGKSKQSLDACAKLNEERHNANRGVFSQPRTNRRNQEESGNGQVASSTSKSQGNSETECTESGLVRYGVGQNLQSDAPATDQEQAPQRTGESTPGIWEHVQGRERSAHDPDGARICSTAGTSGISERIRNSDQRPQNTRQASNTLQGRFCPPAVEDGNRVGWKNAFEQGSQSNGRQEGSSAECFGMGSPQDLLLKILIFAPKSVIYNWPDEVEKWYPNWSVYVLPDDKKERKQFWQERPLDTGCVVISNYEKAILADWPDLKWDVVIMDEVTKAKNTRTLTHKALRKIVKQAKYVFALTGTPLEMKVEELYGIMALVRPAVFGSFMRFRDQHLITNFFGQVVGSKNHQLLKERVGPWITRRTKEEVLTQLPAKLYNDIWVQFTDDEAKEYAQIADNFEAWLTEREEDFTAANALTQLLRLQQYTSSRMLLEDEGDVGSKFYELQDLLNEWEGQAVVFTRFATMARMLRQLLHLPEEAIIAGEVGAQDRVERIKRFNEGQLGKVLISTDAGAYGLNITGADLVIMYDLLFNPGKMWQREDRLHRIGQTRTVNVVRLVVKGTVDAGMLGILTKREELFRDIVDGAEEAALLKFGKAMLRRVARGEAA